MAKSPRILVVDDEMSIRGILNELLTALHYDVVEAPSVEVALVKMNLISFDLVISDIRMAGQSGLELLKQVKEMNPNTEVIIMTSHASLESSLEAIRLGAYDYLLKPFEELEYVEIVVARALSQQQLKKENQALLARTTQKNQEMEEGTGRAARDLMEIAGFYKIASSILKSKNLDELMFQLEKGLSLFLKGKPGIIWLSQREKGILYAQRTIGFPAFSIPPLALSDAVRASDTALCLWLKKGDYKSHLNKSLETLTPQDLIHMPMIYQDKAYGLLTVMNRPAKHWAVHEKNAFVHLCLITAMMCHFFEMNTSAMSLGLPEVVLPPPSSQSVSQGVSRMQDSETGLMVYDCFLELLHLETMRARRYRHPFTLLLLTFDVLSDQKKKPEQSAFLQEWAKQVLSRIRTTDIAARANNKIFILLPETNQRESRKVRRLLKREMASLAVLKPHAATYGAGKLEKVTYPKDGDTARTLIAALELALSGHAPKEGSEP